MNIFFYKKFFLYLYKYIGKNKQYKIQNNITLDIKCRYLFVRTSASHKEKKHLDIYLSFNVYYLKFQKYRYYKIKQRYYIIRQFLICYGIIVLFICSLNMTVPNKPSTTLSQQTILNDNTLYSLTLLKLKLYNKNIIKGTLIAFRW